MFIQNKLIQCQNKSRISDSLTWWIHATACLIKDLILIKTHTSVYTCALKLVYVLIPKCMQISHWLTKDFFDTLKHCHQNTTSVQIYCLQQWISKQCKASDLLWAMFPLLCRIMWTELLILYCVLLAPRCLVRIMQMTALQKFTAEKLQTEDLCNKKQTKCSNDILLGSSY